MIRDIEKANYLQPATPSKNLWGKTVVIAGDAGGIGRATVELLVEHGAKVFVGVESPAALSAVFATVAKTGAEWDGMVVDLDQPGDIQRFFTQAEQRLGRIDVFVSALETGVIPVTALSAGLSSIESTSQSQWMQEAVRRIKNPQGGKIISIRMSGGAHLPARLRREAGERGISMTIIEPGAANAFPHGALTENTRAEDIAQCVFESLIQPFRMDVVRLREKDSQHPKHH